MFQPVIGATKALHVGLSDPTFIPGISLLNLPGLATVNGPLIVGGTLIDGIMGPAFPKLAVVNIIPSLNSPGGSALNISALGDGIAPYPGVGLQVSAVNHNIIASSVVTLTTPLFLITGSSTIKSGSSIKNGASITNGITTKVGATTKVGSTTNVTPEKVEASLKTSICSAGPTIIDGYPAGPTWAQCLAKKSFDIPHPSKSGHRLRHVCIETEEAGVYVRGQSTKNVIELPDYWKDFVHEESITVNLTPIGCHQNLYVEKIENNKVYVNGDPMMKYFYTVFAERKDCERNIPEYEGSSPADYPGDNTQSSVAGWDYDRRND